MSRFALLALLLALCAARGLAAVGAAPAAEQPNAAAASWEEEGEDEDAAPAAAAPSPPTLLADDEVTDEGQAAAPNLQQPAPPAEQQEGQEEAAPAAEGAPQFEAKLPPSVASRFTLSNYLWETLAVAGLIAYGINYWKGSAKNAALAESWAEACRQLLTDNFAFVGLSSPEAEREFLIQESSSEFVLYGSGRNNCLSFTAELELTPRQDLMAVVTDTIAPTSDTLSISVEMDPNAYSGFVFAVTTRKHEKTVRTEMEDISFLCSPYPGSRFGLTDDLVVFTDAVEVVPRILGDEFKQFINENKGSLQMVHFSDSFSNLKIFGRDPEEEFQEVQLHRILHLRFALPRGRTVQAGHQLVQFAVQFIDLVASTALSPAAKQKSDKLRAKLTEEIGKLMHKQRIQAAQERSQQKKKAAKEKAEQLGPDALAKLEEQERKRALKKQMKKGGKTMIIR